MALLKEKIADGPVLALIESFLKANIWDGLTEWTPATVRPKGPPGPAFEQHLPPPARLPGRAGGVRDGA